MIALPEILEPMFCVPCRLIVEGEKKPDAYYCPLCGWRLTQ